MFSRAAPAQEHGRVRRVGLLMASVESDPDGQARVQAFQDTIQGLGWVEGRNLQLHLRWAAGGSDRFRTYAAQLVALAPDLVLADATPSVAALVRETSVVPIVFCRVGDPVGSGFVNNLARPGGNVTGFTAFEVSMGPKWLEMLKEASPGLAQVSLLFNPKTASHVEALFLRLIEATASSLGISVVPARVHSSDEIKDVIRALGQRSASGLAAMPDAFLVDHRELIIQMTAQQRVPAIYTNRIFAVEGGLMSYGFDVLDMYRRAASYADRILRGTRPGELPVQTPTNFQLAINLKTANALGLSIPPTLLARADEVIE
ncbi:ABC transporter substrate-binding protein [Microvirga sp. BT689]|uniref:ABC transporter substrate-binding protein n=1 Tax=Microvirga arvi TaxID=2778731 RepID=UPI001950B7BA|nr:ABC transporter substrate-binding protein [Microvirga arvi]MBM6583734.1 ABC transporter substrate-binding protein [Microvirga arvi]